MVEQQIDTSGFAANFPEDIGLGKIVRLNNVWKDFWLGYPAANAILENLQSLYDRPQTHRPQCCILYGETNSGKSHIAHKFLRDHYVRHTPNSEQAVMPVVMVTNPPHGDLRGFYTHALRTIGVPHQPTSRLERLLEQLQVQLVRMKTRMMIVDEIQHILAGKADQRIMFMNCLKFLSNELQIPVIAIGTIGALRTLYTDPQLSNRFEPIQIQRWNADASYALFLAGLAGKMGLEKKSEFKRRDLVTAFHTMTEGLTGETRKLMGAAAVTAIQSGREVIDMETLEATGWVRPVDRRKGG